jgi:hypothetical protein
MSWANKILERACLVLVLKTEICFQNSKMQLCIVNERLANRFKNPNNLKTKTP